jgi:hypothetical protein
MIWVGILVCMGTGEDYTGLWFGDLSERNRLEKTRRLWKNNIKMDLQIVGWGGSNWIYLA